MKAYFEVFVHISLELLLSARKSFDQKYKKSKNIYIIHIYLRIKQIYITFRYVDKRHGWTVGRANRVLG